MCSVKNRLKKKLLLLILIALLAISVTVRNHLQALSTPTLQVEAPQSVQVPYLNDTFDVKVTLKNVDAGSKLVGVQFRLRYNTTILEVVNVTEGSFFQDPRWDLYGTFWISYVEDDVLYGPHVLAGSMIYPNTTNGEWDQTQFPEGSGIVATITFKVLQGPPSAASFKLIDTELFDPDGNKIPYNLQGGQYGFAIETLYHHIAWETQSYIVVTKSNVTVDPLPIYFDQPHRALYFNITGPEDTIGYCNVTIPKTLFYATPDQWLVIVGGEITDYQATEDETNTYLHFACSLSRKTVYIIGTEVIPEFPVTIIPIIFLVAILSAVVLAKFTKSNKLAESPVKSSECIQIF